MSWRGEPRQQGRRLSVCVFACACACRSLAAHIAPTPTGPDGQLLDDPGAAARKELGELGASLADTQARVTVPKWRIHTCLARTARALVLFEPSAASLGMRAAKSRVTAPLPFPPQPAGALVAKCRTLDQVGFTKGHAPLTKGQMRFVAGYLSVYEP